MNAALAKPLLMTAVEYFAWEAEQTERHDYYQGEVFAMAGGSDAHNTASLNFALAPEPIERFAGSSFVKTVPTCIQCRL